MQLVRVQLQPGWSELQLVRVQLQLVRAQLQSVPSSCNWSILRVAIDLVSRFQLQSGCILYRECTLLHFTFVVCVCLHIENILHDGLMARIWYLFYVKLIEIKNL